MKKLIVCTFLSCLAIFSFSQSSNKDSLILSSFYQGSANNCASVALIKAAMYKYGYNHIFSFKKIQDKYNIALQDGTVLIISDNELKEAIQYSKFDTTGGNARLLGKEIDSILFYEYMSYACIAKFIQEKGYWDCEDSYGNSQKLPKIRDYSRALWFISRKSFCTDNCHRLLGLKIKGGKINDFTDASDLNEKGIILYSWAHAVAVFHNQIDCHGDWIPAGVTST